jgi:hypothetical protein
MRHLSWIKMKAQVYRKLAKRRKRETQGIWDHFPEFEDHSPELIENKEARMRGRAAMKRWNGRRSMFLGNYKNRRDAAFSRQENTGYRIEDIKHPVLDRLFGAKRDTVSVFPCVKRSEHTRRRFGIGEKFGLDFDLSGVCPVYGFD